MAMQVQPEGNHRNEERIDVDGLPHVGAVVYPGQGYYSKVDCATGDLYYAVHEYCLHGRLADCFRPAIIALPADISSCRCLWHSQDLHGSMQRYGHGRTVTVTSALAQAKLRRAT